MSREHLRSSCFTRSLRYSVRTANQLHLTFTLRLFVQQPLSGGLTWPCRNAILWTNHALTTSPPLNLNLSMQTLRKDLRRIVETRKPANYFSVVAPVNPLWSRRVATRNTNGPYSLASAGDALFKCVQSFHGSAATRSLSGCRCLTVKRFAGQPPSQTEANFRLLYSTYYTVHTTYYIAWSYR